MMRGFAFEQEVSGGLDSGARFSPDYRYRYTLWRRWDSRLSDLVVIGLNPSTADAMQDDPTIRRCIGFAKRERCGGLFMLNLFALRATDPKVMLASSAPVGPGNDDVIRKFALDRHIVVAAWGAHGGHRGRDAQVRAMVSNLKCFGVTKDGHPKHPLYLKADTPIIDYPRGDR